MRLLTDLYRSNLALHTDFYQLTSAYALWKNEQHLTRASYYMFHRSSPFGGGYAIAAGLQYLTDWMRGMSFEDHELGFLSEVRGNDGEPLFEEKFLRYLSDFEFKCDVDAVPEGTVVFPHEPMVRVLGSMVECLFAETFMLNVINSQSLFATKASRVREAAGTDPVLEFGLRRAQGIDGGIAASRGAYIGGVDATSNVQAAFMFGIPTKGTHPHGFVMYYGHERTAFNQYAQALPNNCVFLVDTYDTIQGVKNAIEEAKGLRARGHKAMGIRLDSGDLAYLSIEARKLLDEAGFPEMKVYASNDLDERIIQSLKQQGAKIDVWGVGTKLTTAYDQPAFGGVFKLSAVEERDCNGRRWVPRIKLSEQAIKTSNPGILSARRFYRKSDDQFLGDAILDDLLGLRVGSMTIVDPMDATRQRTFYLGPMSEVGSFDLLKPFLRNGELVARQEPLVEMRERALDQLSRLHPGIRRFDNPHSYPVGLEETLFAQKTDMIRKARRIEG